MAVEITNLMHAMATITLANPPVITKNQGIASIVRDSAGVYSVTLVEPLQEAQGQAVAVHGGATSRVVNAAIAAGSAVDNLKIYGFTDAGVAADTGQCYLQVWRYPTND
jgi:hypothetical protein